MTPTDAAGWATLARDLGVSLIQISERDTQATDRPKRPNEFVNTWSIDGFIDELMQPSELSLGTSEPRQAGAARTGIAAHSGSVYLHRPGGATFARSWLPSSGGFQGLLMTHDEVFSIADYLSLRQGSRSSSIGRPSCSSITPATTRCCRRSNSKAAAGCRSRPGASSARRS